MSTENASQEHDDNTGQGPDEDLLNQVIVNAATGQMDPANSELPGPRPSQRSKPQSSIAYGTVVGFSPENEVMIQVNPESDDLLPCDILVPPSGLQMHLLPGDQVITLLPVGGGTHGCVLGRVGRYHTSGPTEHERREGHVVIRADERLSIQCGEASVELRSDGKLAIQGKDVLSKAKRTQRIKGGNVAIN